MPSVARLAPILIAAAVTACTTVPAEQRAAACQATDWYKYGLNDGTLGVAPGQRAKRFADCAELGYPVDTAAYGAGRAEGLGSYCTVENGYEVGYAGRPYRDVCPPQLEPDFLQGYNQGRRERPLDYRLHFGYGYYDYPYWGGYYWPYRRYYWR